LLKNVAAEPCASGECRTANHFTNCETHVAAAAVAGELPLRDVVL
jgi:hypothetical protein